MLSATNNHFQWSLYTTANSVDRLFERSFAGSMSYLLTNRISIQSVHFFYFMSPKRDGRGHKKVVIYELRELERKI